MYEEKCILSTAPMTETKRKPNPLKSSRTNWPTSSPSEGQEGNVSNAVQNGAPTISAQTNIYMHVMEEVLDILQMTEDRKQSSDEDKSDSDE